MKERPIIFNDEKVLATSTTGHAVMAERPILFADEMVRAILSGRKSQTRRIVKGIPLQWLDNAGFEPGFVAAPENHLSPLGFAGDRLWVRECFAWVGHCDPGYLTYRATYPKCLPAGLENVPSDIHDAGYRWKPSIHMKRSESRITLEIIGVRVERLQDISEEDAQAEGVQTEREEEGRRCWVDYMWPGTRITVSAADSFASLWQSIYGAESWDENPWVWVVEFKRVSP